LTPDTRQASGTTTAESSQSNPFINDTNPRSGWDAAAFVWAVWAIMLVMAYAFIARYGSGIFYEDDWVFVPILSGEQPFSLAWLWKQNNEHRFPLPNLVILGLYKVFDFDPRAGMYFTVTALGLLSVLMTRTAARLRGRTAYSDAFFPLVLLNGSAYDNFLFGHQIFQSLPIFLMGALLCVLLWCGRNWTLGRSLLAGSLLVLLVLCGSMGVVCAPILACWFLVPVVMPALAQAKSSDEVEWPPRTPVRVVMAAAAGISIVMAGVYFIGFQDRYVVDGQPFPYHEPSPSLRATLSTSSKFLSVGFGEPAYLFWPSSGLFILALYAATGIAIVWCWFYRKDERPRTIALLCSLVALGGLALGIGIGRASMGADMGFSSRYVTLSAQTLSCAYFGWLIAAGQIGRLATMVLFTFACASLAVNQRSGGDGGARHLVPLANFERDLRAGMTPNALAARYTTCNPAVYTCRILPTSTSLQDEFVTLMRMLAGRGVWRELRDPAVTEESIPFHRPLRTNEIKWNDDGTARCTGNDPSIVYDLGRSVWVDAIRVKYSMEDVSPPATFAAYWKNGNEHFTEKERYFQAELPVQHEERVLIERSRRDHPSDRLIWRKAPSYGDDTRFWVTIPVNARIDTFRIDPNDKPCTFKIVDIKLVVPARSGEAGRHD
jgi:hypothetical protein